MLRKELKDPRNWLQKFTDQIYGAPEYSFILTGHQLIKCLEGLNSIEDKNLRIRELIAKVRTSLYCPKNIDGNTMYILERLDTSCIYILRNFTELNKENAFSKWSSSGFSSTIERV
jgi:hypothetical protein